MVNEVKRNTDGKPIDYAATNEAAQKVVDNTADINGQGISVHHQKAAAKKREADLNPEPDVEEGSE